MSPKPRSEGVNLNSGSYRTVSESAPGSGRPVAIFLILVIAFVTILIFLFGLSLHLTARTIGIILLLYFGIGCFLVMCGFIFGGKMKLMKVIASVSEKIFHFITD